MSGETLGKAWRTLLVIQLAFVFLALSVFSIGLNSLSTAAKLSRNTSLASQPQLPTKAPVTVMQPEQAAKQPIDTKEIEAIVQQQVAKLPQPAPVPGPAGQAGAQGQAGNDGASGLNGQDGKAGADGRDGQDAVGMPGREIELQSNPLNGNLEWRYIGDDSWQLLMKKCAILGICGATP